MIKLFLILLICSIIFLFFISVSFRCFIFNFFKSLIYIFKDLYSTIKYKKYNNYKADGQIIAFNGLFGSGKTLSMVHYCRQAYKRYNNKTVYDSDLGYVKQYIHIVTNVDIKGIPTLKLTSLQDIVNITKDCRQHEIDNFCRDVFICAVDEAAVQMSSRNFKGSVNGKANFNMEFINSLMTCRHYHISFLYTSVRFNNVDAMLRQVTSYAYDVKRPFKWRIMTQYVYDAWDLENTSDKTKVKPLRKLSWFINDSDFNCYDTLSVVESFRSDAESGNLLSEIDILSLRGGLVPDSESVEHKSSSFKKRLKNISRK